MIDSKNILSLGIFILITATPAVAESDQMSNDEPALRAHISENAHVSRKVQRNTPRLKTSQDAVSTEILSGSTLRVRLREDLNTKENENGQSVTAELSDDLVAGDKVVAKKGDIIDGCVVNVRSARRGIKSNSPNSHFRDANGCLAVAFNKLHSFDGTTYDIDVKPAPKTSIQRANVLDQMVAVNNRHEIALPYHAGRYTALAVAISAGGTCAGPFGMAGAPVLSAAIGFICPSYGLGRPRYPQEKHGRIKGALMGAIRGSPGGFITSGLFVKGLDLHMMPGDELLVRFDQPLSVPRTTSNISSHLAP